MGDGAMVEGRVLHRGGERERERDGDDELMVLRMAEVYMYILYIFDRGYFGSKRGGSGQGSQGTEQRVPKGMAAFGRKGERLLQGRGNLGRTL